MNGLYISYKEAHSEYPVSFSKFAQLRPKHCILAGASGTHTVCVCTIHQNVKLMLDAINIKELTKHFQNPIKDYKDCLKQIMCQNPTPSCHLNECSKCTGTEKLHEKLLNALEDNNIENVEFSTWKSTDR